MRGVRELSPRCRRKLLSSTPAPLIGRDFEAPLPCPYDASAGTIAATGLLRLSSILLDQKDGRSETYLKAGFDLISAIILHCASPAATMQKGTVDWGKDGWETLLMHSTINGNPRAARRFMDHGLVCEWIFDFFV